MSFHPHACTVHVLRLLCFLLPSALSTLSHFSAVKPRSIIGREATATFVALSLYTNIVLLVKIMGCTGLRYWYTELW